MLQGKLTQYFWQKSKLFNYNKLSTLTVKSEDCWIHPMKMILNISTIKKDSHYPIHH